MTKTGGAAEEPAPCAILSELYDSTRPAVELVAGVPLAPIVLGCWPKKSPETMLSESWIVEPGEEEATENAKAFNPAEPAYNDLPNRLCKSAVMQEWNTLKIEEMKLTGEGDSGEDAEKEARAESLEKVKSRLEELEGGISEVKSSIESDPRSLVSWMKTLFSLADAGLTTWDVAGAFWPYCPLADLFGTVDASKLHEGIEKLLGTFKKRYEEERGPNKIQIFTKFVPNIFREDYGPVCVEQAIDNMKENLQVEVLDMVQVFWWDFKDFDAVPTLRALQKLTEDKVEIDSETGAQTVTEPKKVKAIGLIDFPARALKDAVHAGVQITSVQVAYSAFDRSKKDVLETCRSYGIKALASGGCLGGLISEKYLQAQRPESPQDDLDSLAGCRDAVVRLGGWEKFQSALGLVHKIAQKHAVKMQTVLLRWQMDQGTFPVITARWSPNEWQPFGYFSKGATELGLDPQLFHKASFLDEQDMTALEGLLK